MKFVAIDIGASQTRYASNDQEVHVIPNNMTMHGIDENMAKLRVTGSDILSNLEVNIESDDDKQMFPCKAMIGELANRLAAMPITPSGLVDKTAQKVNYISIVTAVALSVANGETAPDAVEDVEIFTALPPAEAIVKDDVLKKVLCGTYNVEFPRLNKKVKFRITNVSSFEESFLAILSYFFTPEGKLKTGASEFKNGNILSLDIGASTTDLAVIQNLKYLERSGQTYKQGGNIANSMLGDIIREEYGYEATPDVVESVMAEGRMVLGNTYKDASKEVREAKRKFARSIVEMMQAYFTKVGIPIQTIRAIITSGGGSMKSQYIGENGIVVTVPSISEFITEELKTVCDSVEVKTFDENPRLANINGLLVRVNLEMRRRNK